MIRCRARVRNKWYDLPKWGKEPDNCHPCPFGARRDGFCDRHHPEALLPILERQEASLAKRLAKVRADLAVARERRENLFPLNPS